MNWIKTGVLMAALMGLFMAAGHALAGPQGVRIAFFFALAMNFFSYWFSDKIVLAMYRAKEVPYEDAPWLHDMVEELAERADIPKPKVCVMPMDVPNAFATGRSPSKGVVAVTTGIMRMLDKRELRGVIAHELSHIKHRDTLISTMAATIAAAISYLGYMALFFGGGRRDGEGGNPIAALMMFILAPIAAMVIQMAISRSREYAADERGARIAGEAGGLSGALLKLERGPRMQAFRGAEATENLFIVNPFGGNKKGGGFSKLFSTHPSTQERVERLQALAQELGG